MAVGADGRFFDSVRARLAVNALAVDFQNVGMASPARFRNSSAVHPAGRIGGPMKIVGPMTIRTYRRVDLSQVKRRPVNGGIVGFHGFAFRQFIVDHVARLPVAGGAGGRNVFAVNGGRGIPRIQEGMAMPMAIFAGRRLGAASGHGTAMVRFPVNLRFQAVAFGTGDRGQFLRMRQFFGVLMARHAQISTMN